MNAAAPPPSYTPPGPLRRALYFVAAAICLLLGLIGIPLPGLPTTPFLLLMSFFLIRASPWLHDHVLRVPLIGKPIREWDERRGVRLHVKWIAYGMIAVALAASFSSAYIPLWGKIAIGLTACVGLTVVWRLPTIRAY